VAEKLQGPFTDEIRQMLLEVEMGRPRREALEDLANRTGVPELVAFVNAVIQAQQLGTNLGRVLRAQAHQMRVKRRQRAEETARRMPVKMVFPLVFCMMPSLFIVILGPLAVNAIKVFSDV
jgi:tight adherence protein C